MADIALPTNPTVEIGGATKDKFPYETVRRFKASAAVTAGQAVYISGNDTVAPARANAVGTTVLLGIALQTAAIGEWLDVVIEGVVCGFASLTAGTVVYLSAATAGRLADAAAAGAGNFIIFAGQAIDPTRVLIKPQYNVTAI